MSEREVPRRLASHTPRMGLPSGALMWVMALAFMGAGGFTIAMALGPWMPDREFDVPRWVVAVIGLVFLAPGSWMAFSMLRFRRQPQNAPLWDRHRRWPRRWLPDDSLRDIRTHLLWVIGLIIFLTPFNYFLWEAIERGRWFSVEVFGIGLFDLVLLIMLGHFVYKMLRWLRHGRSRLEMEGFPLPLGRSIRLRLLGPKALQPGMTLSATLQAIEARWEAQGSGSRRKQSAVAYAIYEEQKDLPIDKAGECRMEWKLPDEPETVLGEIPAHYWELHVSLERPGIDYAASFLLPVYRA